MFFNWQQRVLGNPMSLSTSLSSLTCRRNVQKSESEENCRLLKAGERAINFCELMGVKKTSDIRKLVRDKRSVLYSEASSTFFGEIRVRG